MALILRLCYTGNMIYFHDEGMQVMSGIAAELGNVAFAGMNATFEFIDGAVSGFLVSEDPRTYDGCIGHVQVNKSDWGIVNVPLGTYGENFTQGPALGYDQIAIISAYESTSDIVDTHILQAFNSFGNDSWIAVSLTVMFMTFLLAASMRTIDLIRSMRFDRFWRLKKPKGLLQESCKIMTGNLLRQGSGYHLRRTTSFTRVIILLIILFCFWVHVYFCSLIKTELAVVKKPKTVEDYEDVLNRKEILPTWPSMMHDSELFKHAEKDSIEGRVWEKAIKMTNGNISRALIVLNLQSMTNLAYLAVKQQLVILMGRMTQFLFRENSCAFVPQVFEEMMYLTRMTVDPRTKQSIRVNIMSDKLPQRVRRMIAKSSTQRFEAGLFEHAIQQEMLLVQKPNSDKMRDCMSDTIIMRPPEIHAPAIHHYLSLFHLCAIFLVVDFVCLSFEIYNRPRG